MQKPEEIPDLHGIHVLVVDDDPDTLHVLETYFAHLGATVSSAANGADGLSILEEIRAHVIVSDLAMPGLSGFEFMERVRRLPGQTASPTPAVALTAFRGAEYERRALAAGFQRYLSKPIDPLVVAVEIARLAAGGPAARGTSG